MLAASATAIDEARAGAWIAPPEGQEIVTATAGERDGLTFVETSAYVEAPFGDNVSFVAAPWAETSYALDEGWRAEATFGLKYSLHRGEHMALAIQGGALWRSDPPQNCGEGGGEARLLAGRSFGDTGFVNLELAGRVLDGGCAGERAELTAGFRPRDELLVMAQLFSDAPPDGENSLRLQVSLVRLGADARGIQIGLRTSLDGEDAEHALVLGLWGRPGD